MEFNKMQDKAKFLNKKADKKADTAAQKMTFTRDTFAGKLFPDEQIQTFRTMDQLFPTRSVSRGSVKVDELEYEPIDFSDLVIETDHGNYDLYDYMGHDRLTSLLIMHKGKIGFERYEFGNNEHTKWMSMSMAKSISTTLVGVAIKEGFIKSIEDQLTDYLPILKGSGYEGVSVKNLLQMTSGVQWNEDQTDPNSERRQVLELQLDQKPGEILKYLATLPRLSEAGSNWNYSTGDTYVVGELLRAATGQFLADYLSEKIWSKLGMEKSANWWLESPDGIEIAGSGFSATLRDYARFANFIMNDGVIAGEEVLPKGWVKQASSSRNVGGERVDYGYMWWIVNAPKDADFEGGFSARGIFGQYMYINKSEEIIIVVWSARAKPRYSEFIQDNDFFNAVVKKLKS